MSASTLETAAFIFQKDYSTDQIADITMRDHVWWAKIHKEGGFGGDSFVYPVRYGNPQGVSGTFSKARNNAKSSKGLQFRAYRKPKYGVVTIEGEAALASKDNKASFYNLVTMEMDRILEEVGDSLAFDFYRTTTGKRGRVAAIVGNELELADHEDARNFKEDMTIIADDSELGSTPRVGTTFVTHVDEDSGKITVDDITDITGSIQVNDYLFRDGDPGTCMEGLEVCTPLAVPTAGDTFREKDRSRNPSRLAGSRMDGTSLSPHVALAKLAVKMSKVGKTHTPDEAFVNPTQFFAVTQALGAKVEYDDGGGTANYGFQFVWIHTSAGSMKLYADPDCPMDRGRASREGSQYVKHLAGCPHIIDLDGKLMLRQNDENGLECRVEAFLNLIQTDPSAQGVTSLATS